MVIWVGVEPVSKVNVALWPGPSAVPGRRGRAACWRSATLPARFPVEAQEKVGSELKKEYGIHDSAYMTSCYTCHR